MRLKYYWSIIIGVSVVAIVTAIGSFLLRSHTFTYRNGNINITFTYEYGTRISGYAHAPTDTQDGKKYDFKLSIMLPGVKNGVSVSQAYNCESVGYSDQQHILVGSYKYYRDSSTSENGEKRICFSPYSEYAGNVEFDSLHIFAITQNISEEAAIDEFVRGINIIGQSNFITKDQKTDWFVYRSNKFGYEFQFPPEWRARTINYPHFIEPDSLNGIKLTDNKADEMMNFAATDECEGCITLDAYKKRLGPDYEKKGTYSYVTINGYQALKHVLFENDFEMNTVVFHENGLYVYLHYWHHKDDKHLANLQKKFLANMKFFDPS